MDAETARQAIDWMIDRYERMRRMPMSAEELAIRFTFHPVQPGQAERYEAIRAKALEFATLVVDLTPESREQSLALTALDDVVSHSNAAIARRE